MTGWRTLACVVSDRAMDELLRQLTSIGKEGESPFFLKTTGPAEVSRILASYAERLGAERVKPTACGHTFGPVSNVIIITLISYFTARPSLRGRCAFLAVPTANGRHSQRLPQSSSLHHSPVFPPSVGPLLS